MLYKWMMEYHDRHIVNTTNFLRECVKLHDGNANAYDTDNWNKVVSLKTLIGKEEKGKDSLLVQARKAIEAEDCEELSRLELLIEEKVEELRSVYMKYKSNIF
jgi:glutamine synthetase